MKNYVLFFLILLSIPSYSQSYSFHHFLAEYKPLDTDSSKSVNYGKSHVDSRLFQTQHGGPQVGILAVKDTGSDSFRYLLNGDPDSPIVKSIKDEGPYSLTAMPRDSMVYVFEYSSISGIAFENKT